MYKRKTKLSPIHISLIALAILVVIAVIVTFAVKKDEPKEPAAQSGIVYDDSAVEGGWETLSQEEIEQRLNDKVQAGMINISCNTAPYFKDGKSEGNVMLVNELNNLYPQKVEFYRNDTGEKIYESKAIAVGSKIERAKLDVELPAGEYECTAYFSNLDPDSGATLGVAGAIIHITIQNYQNGKGELTMKNMKKLVSLLLAVCLMASLAIGASAAEPTTVDVSGGTGTSSVSLSSTSDGTLDGDPAATKMNVTIPTILPIAVGTDGTVTTATDIRITNNSFGAVKVDNVKVEAGTGWKLTAFGSKDSLAKVKVDSNMIGFKLALGGGAEQLTNAENAASQTLIDGAIEGCYMSGNGDQSANSIGIAYDAIVSPVSEAVVNASVASVLFVICWDAV